MQKIIVLLILSSVLTGCGKSPEEKAAEQQAIQQEDSQKKLWTLQEMPPPKMRGGKHY